MRAFVVLLLLFVSVPSFAIEFKPYPSEKITESQWTEYFEKVKKEHGSLMQNAPNQPLVIVNDLKGGVSYAFTKPGHPAHPAWIARTVVEQSDGIYIRQIGYFAGDWNAFQELYRQYKSLNEEMKEFIKAKKSGKN